ncbi:tetratricopeptide repeat protein 12 isoform X2 [Lethenteron reissneri]|uniref:tetratricopeptide repeat protein 12 isoform X2 n=1 Tax=Lethenteron reissneri TaxID=7753 RepID=UPI002AB77058|nr:tetratricopeptide repeat protein 12 isoform X2 [Lethenteron reissneri]
METRDAGNRESRHSDRAPHEPRVALPAREIEPHAQRNTVTAAMVDSSTDEQLGRFLGRVDDVADLLARMNSPDEQLRRAALAEADRTIQQLHDDQEEVDGCRVRLDRTVISAAPAAAAGSMEGNPCPEMSQDAFVSLLEKDARERADRRRENERLALGLKERGNNAFREGDFASALARYSEGLDACRDLEVLYTNRAQTFLKLGRPAEALADCEWALRCNERSVKARVLMGKSQQALGQFTEGTYEAVLAADPTHKILIQGLLRALERERLRVEEEEEEREARAQLSGAEPHAARSLLAALGHLRGSSAPELARHVRSLASSIHSPTTRALFRIEDGFEIITGNATLLRSLCGRCVGEEETALCVSLLQLLQAACQDDDASVGRLLASLQLRRAATEAARAAEEEEAVPLLGALRSDEAALRLHAVRLLRTLSQTEAGREQLLGQFDVGRLLSAVASTLPSVPASLPLDVITQLGTHPRFRRWLREDEARAALLAPLERCLARGEPTCPDAERLASCVAALATLAGYGGAVRAALATRRELWDACLDLAERCVQDSCARPQDAAPLVGALLGDLVGLLLRLAEEDNDTVKGIAGRVTRTCLPLLDDPSGRMVMMSLALLGRVLPRSEVAVNDAVSAGVVSSLLGFLEARDGGRVAVLAARPLAAVTQKNAAAREQLAQSRAGLDALLALIEGSTGAGEGLEGAQGNAALCLGHCAASPLLPGRAVSALMRHAARSDAPPALRANCAIALAKMCRAQPRLARRLRRREHGMELLRDCAQLLD